jgi:hypothetical protein
LRALKRHPVDFNEEDKTCIIDEESQRAITVWVVFIVLFLVLSDLFYVRN